MDIIMDILEGRIIDGSWSPASPVTFFQWDMGTVCIISQTHFLAYAVFEKGKYSSTADKSV